LRTLSMTKRSPVAPMNVRSTDFLVGDVERQTSKVDAKAVKRRSEEEFAERLAEKRAHLIDFWKGPLPTSL